MAIKDSGIIVRKGQTGGSVIFGVLILGMLVSGTFTEAPPPPDNCLDNIDNDEDGLIDIQDPECDPNSVEYTGSEEQFNAPPPPP